jgi:hypothetical protein
MPYKNIEERNRKSREYNESHKEQRSAYQKEYHKKHREEHRARCSEWYKKNKHLAKNREYEYRLLALDSIGGRVCSKCGFSDIRALQIDHINGGGTRHRAKSLSAISYYKYIRSHAEEFQVLCANCNWIKRYENGEVSTKVYSGKVDLMSWQNEEVNSYQS